MEIHTTYIVTGKNAAIVWQFKYHLNGLLAQFNLIEGELDAKQINWLFVKGHFPYLEQQIKGWSAIKNFAIEVNSPEYTFELFMKKYKYPVKKVMAERAWNKTSKKNQIKAVQRIDAYNGMLKRKGHGKAMPSTYLNQQYYNDDFNAVH